MLKNLVEVQDRFSLDRLDESLVDTSRWPTVDEHSITEKFRDLYLSRVEAIKAYIRGDGFSDKSAISQREALRLFKKCIKQHPDGRLYGFRALIPHIRTKEYTRKAALNSCETKASGLAGAFNSLLLQHPKLVDLIEREVFKRGHRNDVFESKVSLKSLHKKVIDRCKEFGLELRNAYPFNTKSRAYISLCTYVKNLQDRNPNLAIKANSSSSAAKSNQTSDGSERPVYSAYQRVECDAHHIDAIFCILIPSPFGDVIRKVIRRLWIVVVQEVMSRAILGYHLSLRAECNASDVLEAVKMSLSTWEPRDITIPKLTYHKGAGFPSSHHPSLVGVTWNEFSVDAALANTCDRVKSKLRLVSDGLSVPVVINRHNPNDRPFIERFFQTLERHGFHRLANTTGTGIDDPSKKSPELAAIKYEIQLEHLEELIDVLIANYNSTPHTTIGQRTPIEYLRYLTTQQHLTYANPEEVESLLSFRKTVPVKGKRELGRRPHINFYGVTYTSDSLRNNYSLVGKSISVEANPKDIRLLRAYAENGAELGILRAAAPWHLTPHSLELRRVILSLKEKKLLHYAENEDPIACYITYVEAGLNNKKTKVPPVYLEARRAICEDLKREPLVEYGEVFIPHNENPREIPKVDTGQSSEINKSSLPPPRKAAHRTGL